MFLFVLYLVASVHSAYFPSNLYAVHIRPAFYEMSMRLLANLYKRLTTTNVHIMPFQNKNGLRLVANILRTVTNMLHISFSNEF